MPNSSPMFNGNTLKLGIFSANCSGGMAVTKVDERWRNSRENSIDIQGFDLTTLCGCNEVSYRAPRSYNLGLRFDF